MAYLIGVDGGTESIRAFVFDLEGRPRGSHASAYKTYFPKPSWAEQNPEDWWRCIGEAVRGAVNAPASGSRTCSRFASTRPAARSWRSTGWKSAPPGHDLDGCALGGRSRPMSRPAAIQPCASTATVAGRVSAEWMIPKALWMKRNQPELFSARRRICEYQDYINLAADRALGRRRSTTCRCAGTIRPTKVALPLSLLGQAVTSRTSRTKWPTEIVRARRRHRSTDQGRRRASRSRARHSGGAGRCRRVHRHDRSRRDRAWRDGADHRLFAPPSRRRCKARFMGPVCGARIWMRSIPASRSSRADRPPPAPSSLGSSGTSHADTSFDGAQRGGRKRTRAGR